MSIFLDHNSTTNMLPKVKEAVIAVMSDTLNASSVHNKGRQAKRIIEDTKKSLLESLNTSNHEYDVIFTSSGTESNNLIIQSQQFQNIIISSIEHSSILEPSRVKSATLIPVDRDGRIIIESLEKTLDKAGDETLLSIIYANNETGVIQDFDAIFASLRESNKKIFFHSDISQAYGKLDLDFQKTPFDIATLSGHKFGGPQGLSAIIKKKNIKITPLMYGGGQEFGIRPGTENISAIYGFAAAVESLPEIVKQYHNIESLRQHLEDQLEKLSPKIFINSQNVPRTPNTCSIGVEGLKNDVLLINLDLRGIFVSAGSACSSGKLDASHVLLAYGHSTEKASSSIRVSLGISNTKADIDKFIAAMQEVLIQQNIITESNNE